jgi:uncharacterized protein
MSAIRDSPALKPSGRNDDGGMTRRDALSRMTLTFTSAVALAFSPGRTDAAEVGAPTGTGPATRAPNGHQEATMQVYYLEIVSTDADATCELYSAMYGMRFGDPEPGLGGARTVRLPGGTLLGVREPLNEGERPVSRPYVLVEDIEAAIAAAERAGAEITLPPTNIPGHGTCAIVYQGGIESGLWQLS